MLKLTCESVDFLCKGDAVADQAARVPRTDYRGLVLPDESLRSMFDPATIRPAAPIVVFADDATVGDAPAKVASVAVAVAADASVPAPAPSPPAAVPASTPAGLFASEAWFPHAEDQRAAQFGTATLPFTFRVPPQLLCFEAHVSADQMAARVEVNTIDVRQTHGLVFKREVEKLANKKQ